MNRQDLLMQVFFKRDTRHFHLERLDIGHDHRVPGPKLRPGRGCADRVVGVAVVLFAPGIMRRVCHGAYHVHDLIEAFDLLADDVVGVQGHPAEHVHRDPGVVALHPLPGGGQKILNELVALAVAQMPGAAGVVKADIIELDFPETVSARVLRDRELVLKVAFRNRISPKPVGEHDYPGDRMYAVLRAVPDMRLRNHALYVPRALHVENQGIDV